MTQNAVFQIIISAPYFQTLLQSIHQGRQSYLPSQCKNHNRYLTGVIPLYLNYFLFDNNVFIQPYIISALSMISTWLEDVPQIVLAVMIAIWSSELISKVQIAKAGIAIGEALVHIIISVWQLRFRDNKSYSKKTSCLKRMIKLDLCGGVVSPSLNRGRLIQLVITL
jgi:hypothetical protein